MEFTESTDEDTIARLLVAVPQLDSLFNVSHCIGHGTFSSVFLARIKHTTTINGRRHFAIKHIIPTSHPMRVCMELRCLKMIGGQDNVMGITMCFRQMNHVVLVMPHFPHNPFSEYVGSMGTQELREYLINLLCALRRVHSFRVIHRDVKPANFLYNRRHRRYSLVDFGLAQEMPQGVRSGGAVSQSVGQGGSLKTSPTILDTPLTTSSSKTVKRKLTVYSAQDEGGEGREEQQDKRQCVAAFPSPKVAGILSSTTSRLNTALRRSPRKKCVSHTSPRKENFETPTRDFPVTPKKAAVHDPEDSPSKHKSCPTVEACRRPDSVVAVGATQRSLTGALQLRLDVSNGLRRSPRKLASSLSRRAATPLEGLAKHLHDASALQRKAETSGAAAGHTPTTTPATPKVSGLSTPDVQGTKAAKSGRVLIEVHSSSGNVLRPVSCHCYGSAKVCSVCLSRSNQVAPRAGTPGFRAPEVLLRHPNQDTGVDMWSVGVVLLSLLSGRYPFFRAADDLSNLAEITTLLGTAAVRRAAAKMGKLIKCSEERHPLDLTKVCQILHSSRGVSPQGEQCPGCRQRGVCVCLAPLTSDSARPQKKRSHSQKSLATTSPAAVPASEISEGAKTVTPLSANPEGAAEGDMSSYTSSSSSSSSSSSPATAYPPEAYHLLSRLLDPSPETRITAAEALTHPFLNP
ncbi:cell division cycle 7-related protein kinase-like isoform X3 [Scylla paramamosain]|uniref:cell division cycle 7-related protein kinase-like isoform X3 n=1 Tax=Scylla paramamosain TaxID=85552 RepID=UPI003083B10F